MNYATWILSVIIALLVALNTVFWAYCIRDVGDPQFTLSFLFRLIFNEWFIGAMASAFVAALLSYMILRGMGVLAGRFFLSLSIVATILVGTLVLGEHLTWKEWVGIALIVVGVLLVGRW